MNGMCKLIPLDDQMWCMINVSIQKILIANLSHVMSYFQYAWALLFFICNKIPYWMHGQWNSCINVLICFYFQLRSFINNYYMYIGTLKYSTIWPHFKPTYLVIEKFDKWLKTEYMKLFTKNILNKFWLPVYYEHFITFHIVNAFYIVHVPLCLFSSNKRVKESEERVSTTLKTLKSK